MDAHEFSADTTMHQFEMLHKQIAHIPYCLVQIKSGAHSTVVIKLLVESAQCPSGHAHV